MAMAERERLESKISFLEHTVDALGEVVVGQGREIERLVERLERLEERFKGKEELGPVDPDERPPHY